MMDDRCERCVHGQREINKRRMCDATAFLRPIAYMRHPKSPCGPEAFLFDPMDSKELDYG